MEPGLKSERTGMCLQISYEFDKITGYVTEEKLDLATKYRVGVENYKKIDIEILSSLFVDDLMKMNTELPESREFLCEVTEAPGCALLFTAMIQGIPTVGLPAVPGDMTPTIKVKFDCFQLMSLISFRSKKIMRDR